MDSSGSLIYRNETFDGVNERFMSVIRQIIIGFM